MFWFVHGVFVWTLPLFAGVTTAVGLGGGTGALGATLPPGLPADLAPVFGPAGNGLGPAGPDLSAVAIAAVGLAVSHTRLVRRQLLGRRENLKVSPAQQTLAPYGRLVILHLTIIFGAFVSLVIGSPVGAVVVLVLLKTTVDLRFHVREHGRLTAQPLAAPPIPA